MFRKEILELEARKWNGNALLINKVPAWIVSVFIIFLLSFFILFIIFGSYTKRMSFYGEVTIHPRVVRIYSSVQGFISDINTTPDHLVRVGDELMKIDTSENTRYGSYNLNQKQDLISKTKRIKSIISHIKNNKELTLQALEVERKHYMTALDFSTEILSKAQEGSQIMKKTYDEYRDYNARRLITKDQLSNQAVTYFQQQNNVSNLISLRENYRVQVSRVDSEIKIRAADFENKILEFELQELEIKKDMLKNDVDSEKILRATSDGFIDSISVTQGQMVREGDSLLQLKPNKIDSYYVVFWVTNEVLPYIKKGDAVNLRYMAYPYQKYGQFSSKIFSISTTPASAQEMKTYRGAINTSAENSMTFYKILVKPDKNYFTYKMHEFHFENGMKAEGTIFLEERKIYQWVFSPFYEIQKSAKGPLYE